MKTLPVEYVIKQLLPNEILVLALIIYYSDEHIKAPSAHGTPFLHSLIIWKHYLGLLFVLVDALVCGTSQRRHREL